MFFNLFNSLTFQSWQWRQWLKVPVRQVSKLAARHFEADCLLCHGPVSNGRGYGNRPGISPHWSPTQETGTAAEGAPPKRTPFRLLCVHCEGALPWLRYACQVCALPLAAGSDRICGACLQESPPFDRAISAFYYAPPLSHWIPALKYQRRLELLPGLRDYLSDYLLAHFEPREQHAASQKPEALIAVPLHWRKRVSRGFNQAHQLSRHLSARLKIRDLSGQALRIRNTAPQAELDNKQRAHNLKGAFQIKGDLPKHIALVDDVFTTGATFGELSKVCREAGAEKIEVWSLARAVLHS